jgi:hypothetical protein
MNPLRREIEIRRATQRLLQKKKKPDLKRIRQLTGEIFELQRNLLTRLNTPAMMVRAPPMHP